MVAEWLGWPAPVPAAARERTASRVATADSRAFVARCYVIQNAGQAVEELDRPSHDSIPRCSCIGMASSGGFIPQSIAALSRIRMIMPHIISGGPACRQSSVLAPLQ